MDQEIVVRVDGLEFHADSRNDEPRVLDTVIAERVGLARPTNIRVGIKTHMESGFLREGIDVRTTVVQRRIGATSRPVKEYWFTERGALKLVTKLETPAAHAMVDVIVDGYRAAERMLHEEPAAMPSPGGFQALLAACRTVGDCPLWKNEIFQRIGFIAYRNKDSWNRIHGALRKHLGVVGYLRIPASMLDETRRHLDSLASGALLLPRKAAKLRVVPNPRQIDIPFGGGRA